MDSCIFCKIIGGEVPCYKIWEDNNFLVILDAFPSIIGQVLVIPKKHSVNCLFDFEQKDYSEILILAKKVARGMQESLDPVKIGMVVEGLEVNHVHLKLYPLEKKGLVLKPILEKLDKTQMDEIAKKISDSL